MKLNNRFSQPFIFLLVLFSIIQVSAQTKLIPVKDFFRNPEKASFQLSPDGNMISYKAPYMSRQNIFVQKTGSTVPTRLTSETARDISYYFWKGNTHILYVKDFGGDENFHLFRA